MFRLIGPGVTPFDTNKQKILLYAVGYTIANVEFADLRITNVQVSMQQLFLCPGRCQSLAGRRPSCI